MDFVITPYQAVGSIHFGMTRSDVRQILGGSVNELTEPFLPDGISSEEINLQDSFDALNLQVAYKPNYPYPCIAVTLYEPASLIFRERNLLNTSIEDLRAWLSLIDDSTELIENQGVVSYGFGIGLYTDDYELFKDEPPKSVTVFEEGHFK